MHFKSNNTLFYTQLHLFLQKGLLPFQHLHKHEFQFYEIANVSFSKFLNVLWQLISWKIFPLVQEAKTLCFFNGITFLEIWRIKLWFLKAWYSLKVTFFLSVSSGNVFDTNTRQISWKKSIPKVHSHYSFHILFIVVSHQVLFVQVENPSQKTWKFFAHSVVRLEFTKEWDFNILNQRV